MQTLTTPSFVEPPAGAERRRARRVPLDSNAELYICPSSTRTAPLKVKMRDVSATGVGVVHTEPLPVGQKYVVKEPTISRTHPALFTVVRAERIADNCYSMGLHASHLLDNRFVHSESGVGVAQTSAMAKLLVLAIFFGCLLAVWSMM